jgi:hypothetical protein
LEGSGGGSTTALNVIQPLPIPYENSRVSRVGRISRVSRLIEAVEVVGMACKHSSYLGVKGALTLLAHRVQHTPNAFWCQFPLNCSIREER